MTGTMDTPAQESLSLVEAARSVADVVREHAAAGDRAGELPDATVQALRSSGLFRALQPRWYGGLQRLVPEFMEALEVVAQADGSAAWALMIGAGGNALGALLPQEAPSMWQDPGTVAASVFAPFGVATPVPGGYRVTGQCAWGTCIRFCEWAIVVCTVTGTTGEGEPDAGPMLMYLAAGDLKITENWDVMGLRGTGSHDFSADDVFVPSTRSARFEDARSVLHTASVPISIYFAPVSLGVARTALDTLRASFLDKQVGTQGRSVTYAQIRYAEAEALLRSARAFARDVARRASAKIMAGEPMDNDEIAEANAMVRHVTLTAAKVTEIAHELAGSLGLREGVLTRAFRDAHAIMGHVDVATHRWEGAGRRWIGE